MPSCLEPQKWIPLTLLVQLQSFPTARLGNPALPSVSPHKNANTVCSACFYKSKEKEQQELINWSFLIWEHFTAPAEELSMVNSLCLTAGYRFSTTVSCLFPYYIQQNRIWFQPERSTWNCQAMGYHTLLRAS